MSALIGLGFGFWLLLAGPRIVAADGALNEYTVALAADMPTDHTLCQVNINHAYFGVGSATLLHEGDQPLTDGGALASARTDQIFGAWVAGSLRLTALAASKGASGYFSFQALDENGVGHRVWGGFHDVTIR